MVLETPEEDLKKAVQEAKAAVEGLEEPFKTEGFKIILSKLLKSSQETPETITKKQPAPGIHPNNDLKDDIVRAISESITRTKYNEIYNLKTALGKSLFILKMAHECANIEGLLPIQISSILSIVFKLRVTSAAVGMALSSASRFVDRKPITVQGGIGYKYFIMHEGEEYLQKIMGDKKDGS